MVLAQAGDENAELVGRPLTQRRQPPAVHQLAPRETRRGRCWCCRRQSLAASTGSHCRRFRSFTTSEARRRSHARPRIRSSHQQRAIVIDPARSMPATHAVAPSSHSTRAPRRRTAPPHARRAEYHPPRRLKALIRRRGRRREFVEHQRAVDDAPSSASSDVARAAISRRMRGAQDVDADAEHDGLRRRADARCPRRGCPRACAVRP